MPGQDEKQKHTTGHTVREELTRDRSERLYRHDSQAREYFHSVKVHTYSDGHALSADNLAEAMVEARKINKVRSSFLFVSIDKRKGGLVGSAEVAQAQLAERGSPDFNSDFPELGSS